jgi:two-component system KDP operon response regulator KdpE
VSDKLRILIVDDDREIVRGLSVRLRAAGYEVLEAGDGTTALAAALGARPHAILLDICVPGMDGFEVLQQLRQHAETGEVPVVMLSAHVVDQVRARALAMGACCFLQKPYSSAELLSAIQMACSAHV